MVSKHLTLLKRRDRRLQEWLRKLPEISDLDLPRKPDIYAALVRSIAYQQLNGKAAATIFKRFKALFPGERFPKAGSILRKTVPALRKAGLSQAKALAIQDIARKKLAGVIPTAREVKSLSDAQIMERLTVIRGVGPWTVQMMLIFELGRTDVWPVSDFGVQRGAQIFFSLKKHPKPKEILTLADAWAPYRSSIAVLFWRIADSAV